MANNNNKGLGGWDISSPNDLRDVQLPSNASASRVVDAGHGNDKQAQHSGALQLAYSMHAQRCSTCEMATAEFELCRVGAAIYQQMREAGIVA